MRQDVNIMLPWLFKLFMGREMKTRVGITGVKMCTDDAKWKINVIIFSDDIVVTAKNDRH